MGTLHFKFLATFLQRSWITFLVYVLNWLSELLSIIISRHTIDRQSAGALIRAWKLGVTPYTWARSSNVVIS